MDRSRSGAREPWNAPLGPSWTDNTVANRGESGKVAIGLMLQIENGRENIRSVAARSSGRIVRGLWERGVSLVRELLDVLEAAGDPARADALRDNFERQRRRG